jgi:hypothetical protein
MKSTILLTTALFLASAPSPDSKTISELSAGFLSSTNDQGLMAAGPAPNAQPNTDASKQVVIRPTENQTIQANQINRTH